MTNADLFKKVFGVYAEEFWAYPEDKMLDWIASDVPDTNDGDLIRRQDAIEALGEEPEVWSANDDYELGLNNQWHYDVTALKAVPSAQTERKRGKWVHLGGSDWCCSVCGHVISTEGSWEHPLERGLYHCEHCGAEVGKRKEDD